MSKRSRSNNHSGLFLNKNVCKHNVDTFRLLIGMSPLLDTVAQAETVNQNANGGKMPKSWRVVTWRLFPQQVQSATRGMIYHPSRRTAEPSSPRIACALRR
jgi:hypothetical protein